MFKAITGLVVGIICGGTMAKGQDDKKGLKELLDKSRSLLPDAFIKAMVLNAEDPLLQAALKEELLYRGDNNINIPLGPI